MAAPSADVIVVGAGNAAFCAALAAQEAGAKVLMLEAAPEDESGGNSRFTAGSIRVVYNGVDDIKTLVPDLTAAEIETTDFGTYTADQFFDDMARVTQHRADPDLVELLVTKSFEFAQLDAQQRRAADPDLRPPGVQDRGQIQILGRPDGRIRRRRPRVDRDAHGSREKARRRNSLCGPRHRSVVRRQSRRRYPRARARRSPRAACEIGGACLRRFPGQSANGARAISDRVGTSRRCAVLATTPATASAWRSTSAPRLAATGQAATQCSGR